MIATNVTKITIKNHPYRERLLKDYILVRLSSVSLNDSINMAIDVTSFYRNKRYCSVLKKVNAINIVSSNIYRHFLFLINAIRILK